MRTQTTAVLVATLTMAALTTGCRVDEEKKNGSENVRIATPFGGMSVKTDANAVQGSMGMDIYPGATLTEKGKGDDSAADVNMSFGGFHLGVKAANYTTPDAPEKVMAFYRKSMARYGTVIQCQHDRPVGTPTRTQDGLTCDENDKRTIQIDEHGHHGDMELKTGSTQHQRIVSIGTKGSETKIGLVSLDLPSNFQVREDDDAKQ